MGEKLEWVRHQARLIWLQVRDKFRNDSEAMINIQEHWENIENSNNLRDIKATIIEMQEMLYGVK